MLILKLRVYSEYSLSFLGENTAKLAANIKHKMSLVLSGMFCDSLGCHMQGWGLDSMILMVHFQLSIFCASVKF